jgi:hypothetical protein
MDDHAAFRDLIFAEDLPDADRERELRMHLQQCEGCRQLAVQWHTAQALLKAPFMAAPRAGFSGRWKAMAESRLRESSPWQGSRLLALAGGAIFFAFLCLLLGVGSVSAVIQSAGGDLTASAFSSLGAALQTFQSVSIDIVRALPWEVWVAGGICLLILCILWLAMVYRIASRTDED